MSGLKLNFEAMKIFLWLLFDPLSSRQKQEERRILLLQIQNALGKTEHLHPVEAISFSSRLVYSAYLIPYGISIYFKHITLLEVLSMVSSLKPSMLEIVLDCFQTYNVRKEQTNYRHIYLAKNYNINGA